MDSVTAKMELLQDDDLRLVQELLQEAVAQVAEVCLVLHSSRVGATASNKISSLCRCRRRTSCQRRRGQALTASA